ncbi:MAG: OmpH family outer membrane protein [Nonlabens sp.]
MIKKNLLLFFSMMLLVSAFAKAQRGIRVAYINMPYILENVPEYQQAKKNLDIKMNKWKGEMDVMSREIDQLKETLKNERVILTDELIEEKEEEIRLKQEDLYKYQQKRFAAETGDYILQQKQLIIPVEDQVFNEVQKISEAKKYDYVMNADEVTLLYAAERHDISDDVLKAIGRTGKKKSRKERKKEIENPVKEEKYLSVKEAGDKDAAKAVRQEKIDQKLADRERRLKVRDSIRAARRAAQEKKRADLKARQQRRRDSINEVKAAARKKKEEARKNG